MFVPETEGKSYLQHIESNASYKKGFLFGCCDLKSSDTQQVEKKASVRLSSFKHNNLYI